MFPSLVIKSFDYSGRKKTNMKYKEYEAVD